MLSVAEVIVIAEKAFEQGKADEASMLSSAAICLEDAKKCMERGQDNFARSWAIRSIIYSVGIRHEYYAQCMSATS